MSDKTLQLSGTYTDSSLAGNIRESDSLSHKQRGAFIKELEALMLKHKVIRVDVYFDPFKIENK